MARVDVVMPKMGESVMEGTVLEWKKQVGDTIELDETLLEISTDKVDSEVPSPSGGRLVEVLAEEGDTVEVGAPIAVIETDVDAPVGGDGAAPAPEPAQEDAPADEPAQPEAAAPAAPAPAASAPAAGGATVDVVMPKMGESVMEGTVLEWKKQVGDAIELDETLLEISTDKVDSEVPSPSAGVLAEILVEEGDTVEVGAPIARIATGEGAAASAPASGAPAPSGDAPAPAEKSYGMAGPSADGGAELAAPAQQGSASGDGGPVKRRGDDGRFYSPLVRSIAEKEGISQQELESLSGSGTGGRVTKSDVMGYLESRTSAPAAQPVAPAKKAAPAKPAATPAPKAPTPAVGERVEEVKMDRMRQLIAEHMTRSKATSAHVTSFAEIDVTGLVKLREKNKAAFQQREGVKLTYTPFFIEAAVEALKTHPMLNASVDLENKRVLVKKDFHIGIAVALGTKGLLVPIVRDAGQKNLTGLARSVADVAERARNKQLLPDELQGGTFTLTNVGSLGSLMGTPIINQPQVAILSPGAIVKRPVVVEDPELGDVIAIRHMVYVSLSYDHRIIDGAMAASFLSAYRKALEAYQVGDEV
jgi:2-oxoglutarate dehydrogenase E2 component (dihydrolipoamide succinyltransferase)